MQKVRLEEAAVRKEQIELVSMFIHAANAQGFDLDWVEAVLVKAIDNNFVNFWSVLWEHIEIIPSSKE